MARAAAFGLDHWRLATTNDPIERLVLSLAVHRAERFDGERQEKQARRTIRALREILPKGK